MGKDDRHARAVKREIERRYDGQLRNLARTHRGAPDYESKRAEIVRAREIALANFAKDYPGA